LIKNIINWSKPFRYAVDKKTYSLSKFPQEVVQLKDSLLNQPLMIVGNGPSLNQTPLDELAHIFSIGMNKIDLIYPRVAWRPDLVLVSNNLVVKQHWKEIQASRIPSFISWKARWFLPSSQRKNFQFFLTKDSSEFELEADLGVGASGTITFAALQFAYYMGANPVILVGVDHSFTFSGESHSYQLRKGPDVNHFDPNYFQENSLWGTPNLEASERGYRKAKDVFERQGRRIVDATVGGQLDIFEKISVESFIK
jgi:hypothetical protein